MRVLVTQHRGQAGPKALGDFLEEQGASLHITRLYLGEPLITDGFDMWISMGGVMNVGDEAEHPWMARETAELGRWAKAGKPVLGICLGAQLLAAGLGARVTDSPRSEFGWASVWLNDLGGNDPIFDGVGPDIKVLQFHDRMFEVPPGADLLAGNQDCPHQVFQYKRAYGFQPHIEANRMILQTWPLNPEQKTEFEKGFAEFGQKLAINRSRIYQNFWNLARNGKAR